MGDDIKEGDIVHHSQKRYGEVLAEEPRKTYDTRKFWKIRWLDLGVIDRLKKEGTYARDEESVSEAELRLCDMNEERRVLVGALTALSRLSWRARNKGDIPDLRPAMARDGWL